MSIVERATAFLADRVAPRLAFGKAPRSQPSLADLEREAQDELEARINLGRPGPEESEPTRPALGRRSPPPVAPDEVVIFPVTIATRPLDVHAVTLGVLAGRAVAGPVREKPLSDRPV